MMYRRLFTRLILISLTSLGLSVSSVNAALTSIDWLSTGDDLLTVDDNGLQWLDLSQTVNQSFIDVDAQLVAGGTFEGFRYATTAELAGLWSSAGGDAAFYNGWSTQNNGVFDTLAPFWGDTFCQFHGCDPGQGVSNVITGGPADPGRKNLSNIFNRPVNTNSLTMDYLSLFNGMIEIGNSDVFTASALVYASPVPIPAPIWLFGSALIGLVGVQRRKKSAIAQG